MAEPLGPGQRIASIPQGWLSSDAPVVIRSGGERFQDVRAAEARARELAAGADGDAVIVREADNTFVVFRTDELQRAGNDTLDALRSQLQPSTLPDGATIYGMLASRGTGPSADVEHVPLDGRRDPLQGFASDLEAAGVRGYEVRLLRDGVPARVVRQLADKLRLRAGEPAVAQVLQRLDAALSANAGASGGGDDTRIAFDALATTGAMQAAATPRSAPQDVRDQSRHLVASYRDRSQVVLDGVDAQQFQEFVDGWGITGRIRPIDASQAVLRLNAAVWSVARDLDSGALQPPDFGAQSWNEVTPQRMRDLAQTRMREGSIDFARAVPAMLEDATYAQQPLTLQRDGRPSPLVEEPGFSMTRAVGAMVNPNAAAREVGDMGVMRAVMDSAVADAQASIPGRPMDPAAIRASGDMRVALAQWRGDGLPPDASQSILAISSATGVPITNLDVARGTTEAALRERVRKGEIAAFRASSTVDGAFFTYTLRTPRQFALAVRERMDDTTRPALNPVTRTAVDEIIGTGAATGDALQRRIDGEASGRRWRQVGNEVVIAAAAGAVSFGVGSLAAGGVSAARGGYYAIRAANIIAQSASFTATSQALHGEFRASDYARDALMIAPMGVAQRFGGMLGSIARGSSTTAVVAQRILTQAGAVTAGTAAATGWDAVENAWAGKPLEMAELRDRFVQNLAVATTLHGVNLGLARAYPTFSPEALTDRRMSDAREGLTRASTASEAASADLALAVSRLNDAPRESEAARLLGEEVAQRNTALTQALAAERGAQDNVLTEARRLRVDVSNLGGDAAALASPPGDGTAPAPENIPTLDPVIVRPDPAIGVVRNNEPKPPATMTDVLNLMPGLNPFFALRPPTPELEAGLLRIADRMRAGDKVPRIEPGLLADPVLGPRLIEYNYPTSNVGALPQQVVLRARALTDAATYNDGVVRMLDTPVDPATGRALTADAQALDARVARMGDRVTELTRRAREGDPQARLALGRYTELVRLLNERRTNNSTTAAGRYIGSYGRTQEGATVSRGNIANIEAQTRVWLETENRNAPLTAEQVRNRVSELNRMVTAGVEIYDGAVGTDGRLRGPGEEVSAGDMRPYLEGEHVSAAMDLFGRWFEDAEVQIRLGRMTPVELAARSYQTLVSIHPFLDGNGRTTRAFMDWVLQRYGLPAATLLPGHEVDVARFSVPVPGQRSPDDAARSVTAGVSRSLTEMEAVLFGNGDSVEHILLRRRSETTMQGAE